MTDRSVKGSAPTGNDCPDYTGLHVGQRRAGAAPHHASTSDSLCFKEQPVSSSKRLTR
jgi:hypothetical protein